MIFRAAYFTPWYGDYSGDLCSGVQTHVLDCEIFRAVETGLKMIEVVRHMVPDHFKWRYSEDSKIPYWFDQLVGTDRVRKQMEAGIPVEEISLGWQAELDAFDEMRRKVLLY